LSMFAGRVQIFLFIASAVTPNPANGGHLKTGQ
jgi:hypothetical protein